MSRNNRPPQQTFGRLTVERLESREVPATITYTVNTSADDVDSNLADNVPQTATGQVSLRSAMQHVTANGNANDTYVIDFQLPPGGGATRPGADHGSGAAPTTFSARSARSAA